MKQKIEEKLKAISLRKKGYSLNEIVEKVGVAKSSVSVWVRNIPLNNHARKRLLTKIKIGQLISAENKRRKTKEILDNYRKQALKDIRNKGLDKITAKIICSLIYWCEGTKNYFQGLNFTNSDPRLIKTFLYLLRKSFNIDEKKFRPCIHLHKYHNPKKQLNFWSKATKIPKTQFIKPFIKLNTGKRIRENYPGCIAIRYHNSSITKQLLMIAETFLIEYDN